MQNSNLSNWTILLWLHQTLIHVDCWWSQLLHKQHQLQRALSVIPTHREIYNLLVVISDYVLQLSFPRPRKVRNWTDFAKRKVNTMKLSVVSRRGSPRCLKSAQPRWKISSELFDLSQGIDSKVIRQFVQLGLYQSGVKSSIIWCVCSCFLRLRLQSNPIRQPAVFVQIFHHIRSARVSRRNKRRDLHR